MALRKFDAGVYDRSPGELTAEIYARMPDGTWLQGLDAFRVLGAAAGLRPLILATQIPLISSLFSAGYRVLAQWMFRTPRSASDKTGTRATVTTSSSGAVIRTSS
jgi:hypothetical protein